jgi:RNA polymerase-binding transcription factor DksA
VNLPNYFLADLPPEATLSPTMIAEACQTLKRNRERYLLNRRRKLDKSFERRGGWLAGTGKFIPQARAGARPGANGFSA